MISTPSHAARLSTLAPGGTTSVSSVSRNTTLRHPSPRPVESCISIPLGSALSTKRLTPSASISVHLTRSLPLISSYGLPSADSRAAALAAWVWLKSSLAFRIPHFALSILCLAALTLTAQATSITLQGGFGYPATQDSSGAPLETGHKVSIGTFADDFDPATATLPEILAAWRQFHFTTTETIDGDPGSFWLKHTSPTGNVTVTLPDGSSSVFSFPDKKIYLLLTRTDAAYAEPAADGSNVRDFALFTSTHSSWKFPAPASESNLPPGDLRNLNTSQITTALAGTADPATGLFALASYSSPENPEDPGETPSAFDQWLAATFGENSTITADSTVGPAGLSALATFALDSSPEATAPPYTTVTDEDGRIGIEFTRKKEDVSGLRTFAQACTTLSSWALPVTEVPVSSTDTTETLRAFPVFEEGADTTKAFFRIRVEPANQN